MPQALVAEGAMLHFQCTASSKPGSIFGVTGLGGAVGVMETWANRPPQVSQRGAMRDIVRTIGKGMISILPEPSIAATRNRRSSRGRSPFVVSLPLIHPFPPH